MLEEIWSTILYAPTAWPLERVGRDEDVDPGQEGGEAALTEKLHLDVDEEIAGLAHLPLQVHGAGVGVQLAGAEVVLLVATGDADDDAVPRVGGRWPDAEDQSWDDDVGLEVQLVVGDPQRHVLTLQEIRAADALAASGGRAQGRQSQTTATRTPS